MISELCFDLKRSFQILFYVRVFLVIEVDIFSLGSILLVRRVIQAMIDTAVDLLMCMIDLCEGSSHAYKTLEISLL